MDLFELKLGVVSGRGVGKPGIAGVTAEFLAMRLLFVDEVRKLIKNAAKELRAEAERQARLPKSGIQHDNLPNRSSAPGEAPAEQSGALLKSIYEYWEEDAFENRDMIVTIGPTVDYALYLHQGLKGPGTERPIMEPGFTMVAEKFYASLQMLAKTGIA